MNPEPVAHSQTLFRELLPFSLAPIILWVFAALIVVDVILKLWLLWLKHRTKKLDAEIRRLARERLLAQQAAIQAAIDDSYWFDSEGHNHSCNRSSTNHHDD